MTRQPLNVEPWAQICSTATRTGTSASWPRGVHDGNLVQVVWCSAPAWRLHQKVDQMRWIELRTVNPETGAVDDGPEGLTLVYGDLHEHSSLSSCYAMTTGRRAADGRGGGAVSYTHLTLPTKRIV